MTVDHNGIPLAADTRWRLLQLFADELTAARAAALSAGADLGNLTAIVDERIRTVDNDGR
ncbi:hypothetical protein Drose_01840 [Dactylosporangium roseum]|uniref:Uncharacterized protein n=1 Tax=Dactylosporangium roseum TaxID=47989 RepID=A0ABY5Z4V1_9ACTN|nr:hypothetical protein [Dactylosporangium roseum]UWZ37088.1 hypothetical protein Drose_01840 [Dactylosporangium roseum]